jgi:3-phenylpropionate/cinnamic acid dioxygenase small subunit
MPPGDRAVGGGPTAIPFAMNASTPRPEETLFRYAELIDAGDFDAVGELFDEAVVTDAHGAVIASGRAQVADLYRATTRRFDDGTPKTMHVTTNVIVESSGDEQVASVRSYYVVMQLVGSGPLQPIAGGRYHDRLELVDGAWRFRERKMIPEMFGDVSQHLLFDVSRIIDPEEPR